VSLYWLALVVGGPGVLESWVLGPEEFRVPLGLPMRCTFV